MARIFKLTMELFPPGEFRDQTCVEVHEQIRGAMPNRVLHFGLHATPTADDLAWLEEVISLQIRTLVYRTCGIQDQLDI